VEADPGTVSALTLDRGFTDRMGQLNHARGGRIRTRGSGERGDGRLPRREDARRAAGDLAEPGSGTWPTAAGSKPSIRAGGPGDDEGGPGDSPASVAWLRSGRGTGYSPTSGRGGADPAPRGMAFGPGAGRPRQND